MKNLQHDFPKLWGGQKAFGTFLKIHPFWWRHLSVICYFLKAGVEHHQGEHQCCRQHQESHLNSNMLTFIVVFIFCRWSCFISMEWASTEGGIYSQPWRYSLWPFQVLAGISSSISSFYVFVCNSVYCQPWRYSLRPFLLFLFLYNYSIFFIYSLFVYILFSAIHEAVQLMAFPALLYTFLFHL